MDEAKDVRLFVRSLQKGRALFGEEVEMIQGDLVDAEVVKKACEGCEKVIHLGGVYKFGYPYRKEIFRTNVEGTQALLEAALDEGIAKFVHVSSAGILYGNRNALISEADFPKTMPTAGSYKASKWEAERLVLEYGRKGLPVVIASPTCPIGAGDTCPTPTGAIIRDFLKGRFHFTSHTGINLVAVEDVAEGIMTVAEKGQQNERYILGNENLMLTDFLSKVSKLTDISPPRVCVPWGMIFLAGLVSEVVSMPLRSWPFPLSLETALLARRIQFFDGTKAAAELGWKPSIAITQSIENAIEWFAQEAKEKVRVDMALVK